jgi:hypothetical protein
MPVTISGDGVFAGLTTVETVDVKHPDSEDVNIVLADDGSVTLDSIPASIQSAIDGIPQIAGIGSNVVQTVKTDTFTTTSTSLTDVTGLSATITPTSATSKVLVIASVNQGLNETTGRSGWTVARGATNLVVPTSPGSRVPVIQYASANFSDGSRMTVASHFTFLDAPATTSATTYVVRAIVSGTTFRLNRGETDNDAVTSSRGVSTITLIEVAA